MAANTPTQEVVNQVLGMRDELATIITKVAIPGQYNGKERATRYHAEAIAEDLLGRGLVNLDTLHERLLTTD